VTAEDFVRIVDLQAAKGAAEATLSALVTPPGRTPALRDRELASWYQQSSPAEKANIKAVVEEATQQAVFSVFALLDGVASLGAEYGSGELALFYRENKEHVLLNDPNGRELHNIFNRLSKTPVPAVRPNLRPFEAGPARSLLQASEPGDGFEIHHVPDRHYGNANMHGYDPETAPAIALPKAEHRRMGE
jgi:hypothetical protein